MCMTLSCAKLDFRKKKKKKIFADEGVEMANTHASVSIEDEAILPSTALVDSP
jgi:hypothetical protein